MRSLRLAIFFLAISVFTSLAGTVSSSASRTFVQQLDGRYNITVGKNPDGSPYKGSVLINKVNKTYSVKWTVPNTPAYQGVGVVVDNVLGIGWARGGDNGVVIYRVNGGSLSGVWAQGNTGGETGIEELQGPTNLNGVYKIVNGVVPGGAGKYTGSVSIKPTGNTYSVNWTVGNEQYSGVGVLQGNLLIVGWSVKAKDVGVVTYKIQDQNLTGVWASQGGTKLGAESLGR